MATAIKQDLATRHAGAMKLATHEDVEHVPVTAIRANGGTQMRAGLNAETVSEYAAAMLEYGGWGKFKPIEVYHDGTTYWLADGFHRVAAAKEAGIDVALAIVHAGDQRKAILHAAGANADHGLRRTNADKWRSAETLLTDREWNGWSDRDIARACNVSHTFVGIVRAKLGNVDRPQYAPPPLPVDPSLSTVDSENTERTYTTKHGSVATMNTANIGRKAEPEPSPIAEPRVLSVAWPSNHGLRVNGFMLEETEKGWRSRWRRYDGDRLGPLVADRDAATQTAIAALALHQQGQEMMAGGQTRHDHRMGNLVHGGDRDINFRSALDEAALEQLREALEYIPLENNKTKRQKIEARIRKLEREQPTIVEPTIEDLEQEADDMLAAGMVESEVAAYQTTPDPAPTMPDDLAAAGYRLFPVGNGMWACGSSSMIGNWHFDPADAIDDARRDFAAQQEPPLSKVEIINRDLDAYDAEAQAEADEFVAAIAEANRADAEMIEQLRADRALLVAATEAESNSEVISPPVNPFRSWLEFMPQPVGDYELWMWLRVTRELLNEEKQKRDASYQDIVDIGRPQSALLYRLERKEKR